MLPTPAGFNLSERDIRMFLQPAPVRGDLPRQIVLGTLSFIGLSILVFAGLNAPAWLQIRNTPILTPIIVSAAPASAPHANAPAAPAVTPVPLSIPDNSISLTALGISAPISFDSALDATTVHNNLERGVIHLDGTAHPGQQGIVVISGHSSNYFWDKGQYNTIFAPLEKTGPGMQIAVAYAGRQYVYQVTRTYVVKPDNLSVLSDSKLTGIRLLTCTPVGTALNRLVVEAEQISPDPSTNTPFVPAQFTGNIPAAK